jgi:hypothetical protein
MNRFDDLDAVLDHVWTFIEDGPGAFHHPFAAPTFITCGPDARTITLDRTDYAERSLHANSTRRAMAP